MMTSTSTTMAALALACILLVPGAADAQQRGKSKQTAKPKKLYCWNESGRRTCSDTLPPEAVNVARDEFNASSGLRSGAVNAAMSEEERVAAIQLEAQRRFEQAAEQTRQRTEQAMLSNYTDEADLRRVFSERIAILDNNVTTARFNVASMREALINALAVAGDRELAGGKVTDKQAATIRERHGELVAQRRMRSTFERERAALAVEIEDTVQRFRLLKGLQPPA